MAAIDRLDGLAHFLSRICDRYDRALGVTGRRDAPHPDHLERHMKLYSRDLAERVLATAAEAAIGVIAVQAANWPDWIAVPIGAGVAVLKGWLGKFTGNKDSASLAPGV